MVPEPTQPGCDRWRIQAGRASWTCVILFAASNFLLGPLMSWIRPRDPAAVIVYGLCGLLAAQLGLHAIWCVLAPAGLARRLVLGVLWGGGLFVAWALGSAVYWGSQSYRTSYWEPVTAVLLCLPVIAMAVQSPLWVARCFFRWRVFHRRDPARRAGHESLGIRDIFLATGAVAAALSAARLGLMATDTSPDSSLVVLVIGAMAGAVASLLTTLPLVAATLRARRVWLGLAMLWILQGTGVFTLFAAVWGIRGRGVPWREWVGMVSMSVGFLVCLTVVMLVVRKLGYRLYWGRR